MPVKSNAPISIGPGYQQFGIGSFWDGGWGYTFLDIKTSIPQQSYIMPMIELVGYNYIQAQAIRVAFVIYTYSYLISNSETSSYSGFGGVSPYSVYISSDGYVCLKVQSSNLYYVGFSMDAYSVAGNGAQVEIGILAAAVTTSSGNVY